tara:strand:- start:71 stop:406 length:336 start_codon:yes stop_codon:yes gene_type:complete
MPIQMETGVEIKSSGKVVSTIDIEQFELYQDAVDFFTEEDDDGNVTRDGKNVVLELVNSTHRANRMNTERASKTRSASPINQLRKKVKDDPNALEKVNALLSELDLDLLSL